MIAGHNKDGFRQFFAQLIGGFPIEFHHWSGAFENDNVRLPNDQFVEPSLITFSLGVAVVPADVEAQILEPGGSLGMDYRKEVGGVFKILDVAVLRDHGGLAEFVDDWGVRNGDFHLDFLEEDFSKDIAA